jgi:hypothetical protein
MTAKLPDISVRLANATAWIELRWFRTAFRSRMVTTARPGPISSIRAPMVPV